MDVRYSPDQIGFKKMTSNEIRDTFLIDQLFKEGKIYTLYSDIDRSITGSALPTDKGLKLGSSKKEMAAEYFAQRRELGVINIGELGSITIDGRHYTMQHKDALYIGRGTKKIEFNSGNSERPAKFYFVSYPAHQMFPSAHIKFSAAEPVKLGSGKDCNKRTIYKYIHPKGIKSCQLVMGLTELEVGSVWNTMPTHTHPRRSEVYMYFKLEKNSLLFHIMGDPAETRHVVMRNEQAVLSPSWSIHSGVGTSNYSFIWAMGGENQDFDDMDFVEMKHLN